MSRAPMAMQVLITWPPSSNGTYMKFVIVLPAFMYFTRLAMSNDTYIVRIPSADVPRALKPEVESVLAELIPLVTARVKEKRQTDFKSLCCAESNCVLSISAGLRSKRKRLRLCWRIPSGLRPRRSASAASSVPAISLRLQIAGNRREKFLPFRTKGKIDFRAMGLTRHIDPYPVWNPF